MSPNAKLKKHCFVWRAIPVTAWAGPRLALSHVPNTYQLFKTPAKTANGANRKINKFRRLNAAREIESHPHCPLGNNAQLLGGVRIYAWGPHKH